MGILTNFLKLLKPEPNDFVDVVKHISENYDKLDENAKSNNETLTNLSENKLDKGTYTGDASDLNTEISKIASTTQLGRIIVGDNLTIDEAGRLSGKKVDLSNYYDKPEIEEKFKNFCPYEVGDIYITTLSTNPATKYLGTSWEKIENRFLLATNGADYAGNLGGSHIKTIEQANLPNIRLQVDPFSLSVTPPDIQLYNDHSGNNESGKNTLATTGDASKAGWSTNYIRVNSGGTTGIAQPYTSALGSGVPFNVSPAYYTVHIWKRIA